jgi:hypothetical protein
MPEIEIVDRLGRRRRARKGETIREGETIRFPVTIMDASAREVHDALAARYEFSPTFSDGSPDHTNPHAPGYRFLDVDDEGKLAAEQAYRERSRRMEDGWKRKGDDNTSANANAKPAATLDEARRAADAAYEARNKRLQNAWRKAAE